MKDSLDRRQLLGGLGAAGLLSACGFASKPSAADRVRPTPTGSPLIDRSVPVDLQTATFALG